LLLLLGGVVLLTVGGKLTVNGAITLATALGLSEALVGLTVVAIGTSLPELATSVVAARRGKADIAVGNIVGSNIFNIFWILGVSAAISPLPFGSGMNVDILVALLATIVLFFVIHTGHIGNRLFFFWRQKNGHVISKHEGGLLVALYVAYIVYLVWRG
jgi:cation:H+ antiporter